MTFEEHRNKIVEANSMREMAEMPPLAKMSISFSGGRTSAVMTKLLWDNHKDTHDIMITFANTGLEHEATLKFVNDCAFNFGWPVVWLEAKIHPERGKGVGFSIVDYESADRKGRVFESAIKKYGIFNQTKLSCTARLKADVMKSFLKSQGWNFGLKRSHQTAIGIRADEVDRVSQLAVKEYGAYYPLVDWGITKRDVAIEIKKWGFDLGIPGDHFGNCVTCWKKSDRKLFTIAKQEPERFDFFKRMEAKYGHIDGEAGRKCAHTDGRTYFFRGHRSAEEIIKQAGDMPDSKMYFDDPWEHGMDWDEELDLGSACGDSCEVGADQD